MIEIVRKQTAQQERGSTSRACWLSHWKN